MYGREDSVSKSKQAKYFIKDIINAMITGPGGNAVHETNKQINEQIIVHREKKFQEKNKGPQAKGLDLLGDFLISGI